jgi:surface-anchored protein
MLCHWLAGSRRGRSVAKSRSILRVWALEDRTTPTTFSNLLTTEHVDIGLAFEGGAWDLHLHDETNDIEYAPDEALLFVGAEAKATQPAGAQWDFLGAGAGGDVWILPQVQNPSLLFLGVGAEEIEAGTFDGDITLNLKAVRGPGRFSLYSTDAFGSPVVHMASADGIAAADAVTVFAGSHTDYNWGFTAIGGYEIDFEATATLPGGTTTSSGVVTYFFRVQNVLTTEHVDIGVEFEDGELGLHLHDETNDVEYEPDGATLFVAPEAELAQPSGPEWEFLGAGAGNPVWVLPQTQDPALLFLGTGAEEVEPGTFAEYLETDPRVNATGRWIRYTLVDVRGPGEFSAFTVDSFGSPVVWMASSDGISAGDSFWILEGSHNHMNWAFTATGMYEIDLKVLAFLDDGTMTPVESGVETFTFGVEEIDLGAEEPDIQLDGFTANGLDTVTVTYTITGEVGPFDISIYRSADAEFGGGDALLDRVRIQNSADLAPGSHAKTFRIGAGPNKIALPGFGAPEVLDDYHVLAVADAGGTVEEGDEGNNAAALVGVYSHGRQVFVHGTADADEIQVGSTRRGHVTVTFNGTTYTFGDAAMREVFVRGHGGGDVISAAESRVPLVAWGGEGNDVLIGGQAKDVLSGGDGDDEIDGGAGGDLLLGDDGNDTVRGGAGLDILFGGDGDDDLDGGPGLDILFGGDGIDRGRNGELMFGIEL